MAESDVDSTPFHPEPGRARRQRRRVLRGRPRGRRGRRAHIPPDDQKPVLVLHTLCLRVSQLAAPRGGAVAARRAHNPKVAGSNPAPATKRYRPVSFRGGSVLSLRGMCLRTNQIRVASYQLLTGAICQRTRAARYRLTPETICSPTVAVLQNVDHGTGSAAVHAYLVWQT